MCTVIETNNVLELYRHLKKDQSRQLDKIQELQMKEFGGNGGFNEVETGVRVDGGEHLSASEKKARLIDLKDEYRSNVIRIEKVCLHIKDMIQKIYTNNDKKWSLDNWTIERLQNCETVLLDYYVMEHSIDRIMKERGYSQSSVYRLLDAGKKEFYELYKNCDLETLKKEFSMN